MEGSGQLRPAATISGLAGIGRSLPPVFGVAVLAVLAAKLALAWRINVNWDEFFYLSHVHALVRGELHLLLHGAFAHMFQWVAATDANEVDQIVTLRLLMWFLLALSAWLLYRLARYWTSPPAAAFAVLAFVGSWPVLKHGASFRADSMLLPLTLGALLLALRVKSRQPWNDVVSGLCLGAAFALTTKVVLFLPMFLAMMILRDGDRMVTPESQGGRSIKRIASILAVAMLVSASLIAVHSTQIVVGAEPAGSFASRAIMATLVDVPFLARSDYFVRLVTEDPVYWAGVLAGLFVAIRMRAYGAAAAILGLLPVIFYRNAFPYFYPLMMAPPAILVALIADSILGTAAAPPHQGLRLLAFGILTLLLVRNVWDGLMTLRFDEQQKQRSVVAAVHKIFPDPVPYLDHSGMIASFPKANFFMSSWGVDNYLRQDRDFMPETLAKRRPPLLLVNHDTLLAKSLLFRRLRGADRQLLIESYVEYWGPIRVAGIEVKIHAGQITRVRLPFPGRYRFQSSADVVVDGRRFRSGETLDARNSVDLILETAPDSETETAVRLVWAAAQEPPTGPPPELPIYSPL